ncbi:MAG: hydantoinase/carbamoylase family amidase [Pseudomonadota bacterium]
MAKIEINPQRLLDDLNRLRSFGAQGKGVVRPAFSDADVQSRKWLATQMSAAGLTPRIDPAGNVFGLPPGDKPSLLVGSHSDTQPEGGWLDGAYGVIVGLEVARTSLEVDGPPVAVVSFQDEEGRFGPLMGSEIWSGKLSLSDADAMRDSAGLTFGEARRKICDLCENTWVAPESFTGYLEAHIEQGIVLDATDKTIGVVESVVGMRTQSFLFVGEQNHAGTTPMSMRRDAFQGLACFSQALNEAFAKIVTPDTVWTIGHVEVRPNADSIIPGQVTFTVQWRDGDDARLDQMHEVVLRLAEQTCQKLGLSMRNQGFFSYPATQIDEALKGRIQNTAEHLAPGRWSHLPSGALHDASNVSHCLPVAMVFVPSINGVSHSFDEDTAPEELVLGAQVLAASIAG